MGLLDKTNPTATRKTLICWAIGTAVFTVGFVALRIAWVGVPFRYWPVILITAAVFGGCIGFLVEWQLDDGIDLSDITFRLERKLSIKIHRDDWWKMARSNDPPDIRVGQLYDFVRSHVRPWGLADLDSDADVIWLMFQQQIADALGVSLEEVTKDTRFLHDLGARLDYRSNYVDDAR